MGIITTYAGGWTLFPGFTGDNGKATSAQLSSPTGVATDNNGNVYICDNNRIRMVSSSTNIITTIVGGGGNSGGVATSAKLSYPLGISVDISGNLYIIEGQHNRVQIVTSAGIMSIYAGTGVAGSSGDGGLAINAQLNNPSSLAADISGNLYIVDYYNIKIRKVSSSGIITTFAGNGTWQPNLTLTDGGLATSAALNYPYDVGVDTNGNVYIAENPGNAADVRMVFQQAPPSPTPTQVPTRLPTMPSSQPTRQPTMQPTQQPMMRPSRQPSSQPSKQPTNYPTKQPSRIPSSQPTSQPSRQPVMRPTGKAFLYQSSSLRISQRSCFLNNPPAPSFLQLIAQDNLRNNQPNNHQSNQALNHRNNHLNNLQFNQAFNNLFSQQVNPPHILLDNQQDSRSCILLLNPVANPQANLYHALPGNPYLNHLPSLPDILPPNLPNNLHNIPVLVQLHNLHVDLQVVLLHDPRHNHYKSVKPSLASQPLLQSLCSTTTLQQH